MDVSIVKSSVSLNFLKFVSQTIILTAVVATTGLLWVNIFTQQPLPLPRLRFKTMG